MPLPLPLVAWQVLMLNRALAAAGPGEGGGRGGGGEGGWTHVVWLDADAVVVDRAWVGGWLNKDMRALSLSYIYMY